MNAQVLSEVLSELYPVEIVQTRYGGSYEGGAWAAFPFGSYNQASDAFGDDRTASEWWTVNRGAVGVGDSPNDALSNLVVQSHNGDLTSLAEISPPVDVADAVEALQGIARATQINHQPSEAQPSSTG